MYRNGYDGHTSFLTPSTMRWGPLEQNIERFGQNIDVEEFLGEGNLREFIAFLKDVKRRPEFYDTFNPAVLNRVFSNIHDGALFIDSHFVGLPIEMITKVVYICEQTLLLIKNRIEFYSATRWTDDRDSRIYKDLVQYEEIYEKLINSLKVKLPKTQIGAAFSTAIRKRKTYGKKMSKKYKKLKKHKRTLKKYSK